MLSKHWKYKTAILTPLVVLQAIFLPAFAQTPSMQLATDQCTDMNIQKHIQQLNKAEQSDFDALVACQSKAVPALIKALKNEDENTRIMIIAALGGIGSQASPAVPLLNELLVRDTSSDVQSITVHALRKINRGRVPVLITNLKNQDWRVRSQAADTLGQIGAEAKDAVPALTAALEDKVQSVRSSAGNALQRIQSSTNDRDRYRARLLRRTTPVTTEEVRGAAVDGSTDGNTTDQLSTNLARQGISGARANPPVMCRIPAIRTVLRWKCPKFNG